MNAFTRSLIPPLAGALVLLSACSQQSADELLTAAQSSLQKKETKAAIIQLKLAIDKNGNLSEARFMLGKALLESGESASAIIELKKALELGHSNSAVIPVLARAMLAEQSFQRVIAEFENTKLDTALNNADLKSSLAAAYASTGDKAKAKSLASTALQEIKDFPAALLLLAQLAMEERDYTLAQELNKQLLQAAPQEPMAWVQSGELQVLTLPSSKLPEGAIAAFKKALELDPTHYLARSGLIVLLLRQNDYKGAETQISEFKRFRPDHPQTHTFEAQLALHKKNLKKAKESIERALKQAPESNYVLQLAGAIELASGSLLQAERTFGKILSQQPDAAPARRQLAVTLIRLGQPGKAIAVLQPLIAAGDSSAETYALAGEANLLLGNLAQSQIKFANAVKLDPKNLSHRIQLALAKEQSNGPSTTAEELRKISAEDEGTSADLALITYLLKTKDSEGALRAADALEKKKAESPVAPNLRGRIHAQRNEPKQARENFERALKLDPMYVPAAAMLATMDLMDSNTKAAKERFASVLAVDPKNLESLIAMIKLRMIEGAPRNEIADMLRAAIKSNPNESAPRLMLVDSLLEGKETKAAIAVAQTAAADLPSKPEVIDTLGRALAANGDFEQAISTYNKLATLEPGTNRAFIRLAGVQLANKDVHGAEQSLARAMAMSTNPLPIQELLIKIARTDKRTNDAIGIARLMQEKYPAAGIGYDAEAAIRLADKNPSGAVAVYRKAFGKNPTSAFAQRLHSALLSAQLDQEATRLAQDWILKHPKETAFLGYLGDLAVIRNDPAQAEKHLKALLAIEPKHVSALNNLSLALAKQKKDGAVAYAEQALRIQPNVPGLLDTLATAQASEGRIELALATQKKAIALAPQEHLLRLNLARLLLLAQDKQAAKVELTALQELGKGFPGQGEVSELLKRISTPRE